MTRYRIGDSDLDPIEQKIVADVRRHGWHVMLVQASPMRQEYAYTIGVARSYGHPEIAIFGIPSREAHAIINDLVGVVKAGERLDPGKTYHSLLDGASCRFVSANQVWFEACFGRAIDFYGTLDFSVLQCVWSDRAGCFPWDRDYDSRLAGLQPNLTADGVTRSTTDR